MATYRKQLARMYSGENISSWRVVRDTPLLSAFLREVFSVVHSHALSSLVWAVNTHTHMHTRMCHIYPFYPLG